jgi:SagB-type dehydrogenase family enzyme
MALPKQSPTAMPRARLGPAIGARVEGSHLRVVNTETGATAILPAASRALLVELVRTDDLTSIVAAVTERNERAPTIDQVVDWLDVLVALDVVAVEQRIDRRNGRTRLAALGAGWVAAADFLERTRTRASTEYIAPIALEAELARKSQNVSRQPSCFKDYRDAPFTQLAKPTASVPSSQSSRPFIDVLLERRTARRFSKRPLSAKQLSTLLFLSWGATDLIDNPLGDFFIRRTSPSGGSLHSVEVYPIVLNVSGISRGSYHYSVRRHGLELLSSEDPTAWIAEACGDQRWTAEAGVIFLCTAYLPRMAWKYQFSRALRVVMHDVGHTSQTLNLVATWLELGAFTTVAIRDEVFERQLGLDPDIEPVLLVNGAGHLEPGVAVARPRHSQ